MNTTKKHLLLASAALAALLITPSTAKAYIGPGAGFAVVGSFFVMFMALLAGLLALLTWPVRWLIRSIKGRKALADSKIQRCIILGLDGMDHGLTTKMLAEHKLPTLEKLAKNGVFKPLATTVPSISPVAWSSFQTGVNPGKHNIYDFLTRDEKTYFPKLSSVDIRPPRRILNFGKFQIPISKADIRLLRKATPFWKTLGDHGIFSNILRVPITFPPERFYGVQLSAMCVPDLRGTQGMFSFYTTQDMRDVEHEGGENFHVTIENKRVCADLLGCPDPVRKDAPILKCPFVVTIKDTNSAKLKLNGNSFDLTVGKYTDWLQVKFTASLGVKVYGICRFLLLSTEPEFKLYITPVNIDPAQPAMPISHPAIYATYLAKNQGSFATLGLSEDSWALNEKILSDQQFIDQCIQTDNEREIMFFDALAKTPKGLCVCVFDGTDRLQHTFWRDIDPEHPGYNDHERKVIEDLYIRMDKLVAKTLEKCNNDEKTLLMIVSDHGFSSFRYGVDLNKWLEENGYLKAKKGKSGEKYCQGIDFSQTRAYAVGLAGIFINLKGRESQGIVNPGKEADELRDEIAEKLSKLHDPIRNQAAIKNVYNALKVYKGPYKSNAPDLLIGYNRGYRASWETAVGQVTEQIFHDNTKAWSGDHCIDPSLVPGVLFCNKKIVSERPRLMDIGPTVLKMFGVKVPPNMDGKALEVIMEAKSTDEIAGKDGD